MMTVAVGMKAQQLDLSGMWHSSLGECRLPGTTDESRLGGGVHPTDVTTQLTRLFPYSGVVTYERDVEIPESMVGKSVRLVMERTKPSTVWMDGDSIGSSNRLYAPHVYELPVSKGGKHHLKIRIDNSSEAVPQGVHGSHAWTDATQTNWNGIIGRFCIEAKPRTHIVSMQLEPDVDLNVVKAHIVVNVDKKGKYELRLQRNTYMDETEDECSVAELFAWTKGVQSVTMVLDMGDDPRMWSEFHPDLYTVTAVLKGKGTGDEISERFGMRRFAVEDGQFAINGNKTFLRGTHDACVFPLTGYCPADVEQWKRMFSIAKQYGINHYRFHSYTPTEAAFTAADELGIYLHTELPLWGTIDSTTVAQNEYLTEEALSVVRCFGNHPSFVSLGLGNELWGDQGIMLEMLDKCREISYGRHLFSYGSNNDLGWKGPKEGEDFYITCRVGGGEGFSTHARTSFSFVDADNGGILNSVRPNTDDDFRNVVKLCKTPIVSHETGQFQIYPDYRELPKYTGVLYPYNLEIFRDRLKENGLTGQIDEFHESTGKWAIDCYKADMEYCLRTPKFGGYQLLDIKDYPGQGSALVGILDAFMDSKGLVTPEAFRGWNAPIVPLARMESHCFVADQVLKFDIALCNYTEDDYRQPLKWSVVSVDADGNETSAYKQEGVIDYVEAWQGEVSYIECVTLPLSKIKVPTQLRINLTTGEYSNYYNVWVYVPEEEVGAELAQTLNVLLVDTLSDATLRQLKNGATVLLAPKHQSIEKQSVGGMFTPDYWNYAMFKTISENNNRPVSPGTLGMLMNPKHPLFKHFPTEGRSDWQWWTIALNSRPLILNSLSKDYRPVIQTVDNVERNHKLGILMEFAVGKGKLLITTTDLNAICEHYEGCAFANALVRYAASDDCKPATAITMEELNTLLYSETKVRDIQGVKNITDYNNHE